MKILIITSFFPPFNTVASLRPYSWAKYWPDSNHEVTVLTHERWQNPKHAIHTPPLNCEIIEIPEPAFLKKTKKAKESSKEAVLTEGKKSLIKESLIGLFYYLKRKRGIFAACRMPDFSDFSIKSSIKAIQKKGQVFDVIVSTGGPYSVHLIAEKIVALGLAKQWIVDFRDYWVEHEYFPGLFPFTLVERYLERRIVNKANRLIVVSPTMKAVLEKRYPGQIFHVVENGFDDEEPIKETSFFPEDGKIRIGYTGTIFLGKRDPSPLFEAIKRIRNSPNQHLLQKLELVFAGPHLANLDSLIDKYQIQELVKQLGMLSRTESLQMQRSCDYLLFLESDEENCKHMLTGKLFEYFQASNPIWAIGIDETHDAAKVIMECDAGDILYKDVARIESLLLKVLQDDNKSTFTIRKEKIQKYTRKNLALKLASLMS